MLDRGCFVEPTIFSGCTDDMAIVRDEIFGPVMSVLAFDTEGEAVARANATEYGLAAGVFTRGSVARGHRVAAALEAGIVWVNTYNLTPIEVPFGGVEAVGHRPRERGRGARALHPAQDRLRRDRHRRHAVRLIGCRSPPRPALRSRTCCEEDARDRRRTDRAVLDPGQDGADHRRDPRDRPDDRGRLRARRCEGVRVVAQGRCVCRGRGPIVRGRASASGSPPTSRPRPSAAGSPTRSRPARTGCTC